LTQRLAVLGEGMIELSRIEDASCTIGHGGDALNTAIHMARLGHRVDFVSALGADMLSQRMRAAWRAEGLGIDHVLTDESRLPGLYAISVDATGERSFMYWRQNSAARRTFSCKYIDATIAAVAEADLLYLSLITLAVMADDLERIIDLCRAVRAGGGKVAFDTNYRPALWSSAQVARLYCDAIRPHIDIALSGIEDEAALFDDRSASTAIDRWRAAGAVEVIIKCGIDGCAASDGPEILHAPIVPCPVVDTSGAGDSFNGGYLAARAAGHGFGVAIEWGQRVAGWVIGRSGAIPPIDLNWSNLVDELVK